MSLNIDLRKCWLKPELVVNSSMLRLREDLLNLRKSHIKGKACLSRIANFVCWCPASLCHKTLHQPPTKHTPLFFAYQFGSCNNGGMQEK